MIKKFIAPLQMWLLSQGQCVGCSRPLNKGTKSKHKSGLTKVACKCGRIFLHDQKVNSYRRALSSEI